MTDYCLSTPYAGIFHFILSHRLLLKCLVPPSPEKFQSDWRVDWWTKPHLSFNSLGTIPRTKQGIIQGCLNDNNDLLVLPGQLGQARPIDHLTCIEGQPLHRIFPFTLAFSFTIYFIRFISPLAARLLPNFFYMSH